MKRPLIITIICILGFIGAGLGILTPLIKYMPKEILDVLGVTLPIWYLWASSIISIAMIYTFIQIWKMRKSGTYLYIGLTIINYILGSYVGLTSISSFAVPAIFIIILLYYLKKMK